MGVENHFKELQQCIAQIVSQSQDESVQECAAHVESTLKSLLLAHDKELESLLKELALVLSCTANDRLLQLVLDVIIRLSRAERGYLLLARGSREQEIVAARDMERRPVDDSAQNISSQIVSTVMETRRPLRLDDAQNDASLSETKSPSRQHALSVLCVPIMVGDEVIGAIYLENRNFAGIFNAQAERTTMEFAEQISTAIRNAGRIEELRSYHPRIHHEELSDELHFEGVIGESPVFRAALNTVTIAARGEIPVLIEGESGTGKDLIARTIHNRSARRDEPFVSVNCAALPGALLESELFGHTRGAFTGAVRERRGLFASADKGTLFLDEIGEMPLELQAKLLRVLQSGDYRPVGSDQVLSADVRIVAATQRHLAEEAEEGRFRSDLYFRLNGVLINLPSLRERKEDIPLLVDLFIRKYRPLDSALRISSDALACLIAYDFPGNIRELETTIRRAVLFSAGDILGIGALPDHIAHAGGGILRLPFSVPETGEELLEAKKKAREEAVAEVERTFVEQALRRANGSPSEAARRGGMNRSQFARMMSKYGFSGRKKTPPSGD